MCIVNLLSIQCCPKLGVQFAVCPMLVQFCGSNWAAGAETRPRRTLLCRKSAGRGVRARTLSRHTARAGATRPESALAEGVACDIISVKYNRGRAYETVENASARFCESNTSKVNESRVQSTTTDGAQRESDLGSKNPYYETIRVWCRSRCFLAPSKYCKNRSVTVRQQANLHRSL
ncbi:unnamed protein product, partial [Iphiclides podalirius]